jgi:hypothetical protein
VLCSSPSGRCLALVASATIMRFAASADFLALLRARMAQLNGSNIKCFIHLCIPLTEDVIMVSPYRLYHTVNTFHHTVPSQNHLRYDYIYDTGMYVGTHVRSFHN